MNAKVITIDPRSWKQKAQDKWEEAKYQFGLVKAWVKDHPTEALTALALISSIILSLTKLGERMLRGNQAKKLETLKELYVYDRNNGLYLKLRKPLTNAQKAIIDQRHREGETVTQILTSMKLI